MPAPTRLEQVTHEVRADHAELRVESGRVVIVKRTMTSDEPVVVTVAFAQVRGAELRKPTRGRSGWLHVAAVGGSPPPPSELAAASDPYTVPVTGRNLRAARRFVKLVTDHVRARGLPHESPGDGPRSSSVLVSSPRPAVPPPGAPTPGGVPGP
ncbi:hypothetical protein [Egicoccus sp. AB-alg6-2]|uniref:hypothetical protein n=1 Tax=Egicoccus sp. AB-alg6-2 TaxID=3242692 RepID=UPI00359DC33B